MAAFVPPVYPNQFEQTPARGDLDLAIMKSGVVNGVLGGAASVVAGDRVKIDTTNTAPGVVKFLPALDTEVAFGTVKRTSKQATFAVGDQIEVAFLGGPVVYEVANATLTPGIAVSMNAGYVDVVGGGRATMGLSLDYAVQSGMLRVLLGFVGS
jgi:hypothetical protein